MASQANKPKFISDEEMIKLEQPKPKFISDEQMAKMEPTQQKEPSTEQKLQAAASGFGKATTFGYFPKISAAIEPIVAPIIDPFVKSQVEKETGVKFPKGHQLPTEDYITRRDIETERLKKAEQAAPGYALGGTAAGLLTTAPLLPGAGAAATGLGRVAQAAKVGGAYGLLQAPEVEKGAPESLQLEERAKQGLVGAATGGITQGAFEGARAGLQAMKSIPEKLQSWGAGYAFKATGADKRAFKEAGQNVEKIGEKLIKKGVIKPGATFEDIADASEGLVQQTGEKLGSIYKTATKKLNDPEFIKTLPSDVAKKIQDTVLDPQQIANELESVVKSEMSGTAGATQANRAVKNVLRDLRDIKTVDDLAALNKFKSSVDDLVKYSQEYNKRTPAGKGLTKIRQEINSRIQSRIDALGKALGEDTLGTLKQLNEDYGAFAAASGAAKNKIQAMSANRYFSPTDYAMGGVVGAAGAIPELMQGDLEGALKAGAVGLGAGLLHRTARKYGGPISASTAYRAGGLLKPVSKLIPSAPPPTLIGPTISRGLLQK